MPHSTTDITVLSARFDGPYFANYIVIAGLATYTVSVDAMPGGNQYVHIVPDPKDDWELDSAIAGRVLTDFLGVDLCAPG